LEVPFKLKDEIYLAFDGLELDLHGIYYFVGLEYSIESRPAKLIWLRGSGEYIKETPPKKVEIKFELVSSFEFSARDPEMPFAEDDCLARAGYLLDGEWCEEEIIPDPKWKTAFEFRSGAVITIKAETGTAKILG
jgi:hypothetical protein